MPSVPNSSTEATTTSSVGPASASPTPPNSQAAANTGNAVPSNSSTNITAPASLPSTNDNGLIPVLSNSSKVLDSRSPWIAALATAGATIAPASNRHNAAT